MKSTQYIGVLVRTAFGEGAAGQAMLDVDLVLILL